MYIADDKIEEIRSASDVVDVVSDYVRLKKRGSNFVGLCPFHNEKTPSFNVNPGMQIYKCFGCGVGGDVFQFVKAIEKVEFPEAAHILADRAGITIPESDKQKATDGPNEGIYNALNFAALYFEKNLYKKENQGALKYLQSRQFSSETLKKFNVGYAANSWDALIKTAEKESISKSNLLDAGLVVEKDSGSAYDRYRNRIIFPIHNSIGKVVGFGGRVLDKSDSTAKYINSPETKVYHKGEILYGLYQSKRAIRAKEEVLLVEGYTDVLSLHQAGVENVIASSGTALTDQQVSVIKRYCKKVVMLFDGDSAGVKATIRGIEILLRAGLSPYIVSLPKNEDPDTFVQSHGGVEFEKHIASEQQDFIVFALEYLRSEGVFDTPEGTAAGQRRIIQLVSHVQDELVREAYIQRASEQLGLAEYRIHDELDKLARGKRKKRRQPAAAPDAAVHQPPALSKARSRGPLPEEKSLIRLMIAGGEPMIELILGNMALDEFSEGASRETVSLLLQMYESGSINNKRLVDGSAGDAVQKLATEVMLSENEPSRNWERLRNITVPRLDQDARASAIGAMRLLKLDRVDEAVEEVKQRIYAATSAGEDVRELQEELQNLFLTKKKIEEDAFLIEQ